MVEEKGPQESRFRFVDLKCYASAEWLMDRKKKYRQVYEVDQLTYITAELSLINLRYTLDDWTTKFTLKCNFIGHDGQFLKELFSNDYPKTISRDEHTVTLREGWGSATPGGYWKTGTYVWVALLDGVVVASHYFYVQSIGMISSEHNHLFEAQSLRLYENSQDRLPKPQRRYFSQFESTKTRYIWGEFTFANRYTDKDWICEVFFNFFNEARELKGRVVELEIVQRGDAVFEVCSGFGSDIFGTWFPGKFTLEIVFMEHLVAVIPFEVGAEFVEEGQSPNWLSSLKPTKWLFGKGKK